MADRGTRRLLHHTAKLTGEDEVVMAAGQEARLDEQHIAAGFRPGDAGRDTRTRRPERDFVMETRRAEIVGKIASAHHDALLRGFAGWA